MLAEQDGKCAICVEPPAPGRPFHVDHDHACCPGDGSCGKCVRGLLCDDCNRGFGMFKDSIGSLVRAVLYLGGL